MASRRLPIGSTSESVSYRHTDALGSPIAATGDFGSLDQRTEHEPYGKMLNRANDNRPGYTGHMMDKGTGLVYMQQRYYDPFIGKFLSVDPITALSNPAVMFNRYKYALNNPYRFMDPDGRCEAPTGTRICGNQSVSIAVRSIGPMGDLSRQGGGLNQSNKPVSQQAGSSSAKPASNSSSGGFSAKGLLVGKPSVEASGVAAVGVGIQATKGLYGADSSVGIVTPALGMSASVDVNLIKLSYEGSASQQAPVEVKMGIDVDAHAILGGGISLGYTPPSTFEFSVDAGAGAGASFRLFEVNAVIDED